MSSEVKRYSWHVDAGCMVEEADGAYVESEDHEREVQRAIAAGIRMQDKCAALEAERERLADALDRQSVITGDYIARCQRLAAERDALAAENEALVRNLRGKHSLVGATYEHLIRQRDEALAKLAELEAIKGQEPVAFYWQDIGYPEPRTHGPHFGQPSESALRNVDGRAIPVLLYTLPPAERDQDQPQ